MSSEHSIQNAIRNALVGHAYVYRVNVGTGWTGDARRLPGGNVLIANPRPLSSGLPPGFADLIGWVPVEITEEHVGRTLGVVLAIEVKGPTGKLTMQQEAFLAAVRRCGGLAGVARSPEDAIALVQSADPAAPTPTSSSMTPTQLNDALAQLGWRCEDAARELGVHVRTLTNWRQGRARIPRAVELLLPRLIAERNATSPAQ